MIEHRDRSTPRRALRTALLLATLAVAASGCQTAGYYRQAISGQWQILTHRQPLRDLIAATNTPPALRDKFQLVLRLREFAARELHLPVDGHYERYVDLHRRFVVWNVHAAPELSLEASSWWYPVVGRLQYRGYFSEPLARQYAAKLERQGLDVYVGGVEAYSTLGWFKDPVLNTFIHHDEADLAEILFHELAHQKLFFPGDTDFNEAFATAVAEEAARRWLTHAGDAAAIRRYEAGRQRHEQFVRLVMAARARLEVLYGEQPDGEKAAKRPAPRTPADASILRVEKEKILARLRHDYATMKAGWGGHGEYDPWFARPLNHARLNTVATYYDLVPGFRRLLEAGGGDLEKFYHEVRSLKKLSKTARRQHLERLGPAGARPPANPDLSPAARNTAAP